MNWPKIRQFVRIGGMILGLLIFSFLFFSSLQDLFSSPIKVKFNLGLLLLSFLLYALVYLSQMVNLKLVYASLDSIIDTKDVIKGFSFSFLPKYIPGYVWGYFTRGAWFEKNNGIKVGCSWVASTIEIFVTIITGFMMVVEFLLWEKGEFILLFFVFLLTPVIGFVIFVLTNKYIFPKLSKLESGKNNISILNWLIIYSNSMLQWILLGVSLSLLSKASGLNDTLSFGRVFWGIYAFARSWLTGFLAFVIPNGIGVREFVLKDLLIAELGIASERAILISTISRILLFVTEMFWIFIAFIITQREKIKDNPNVLL